jgi:hypothetical protein
MMKVSSARMIRRIVMKRRRIGRTISRIGERFRRKDCDA